MSLPKLELPRGRGRVREKFLVQFAKGILKVNQLATQRMTSRGWCYFLEGFNLVAKGDFDRIQKVFNECRKKGYIPIDLVAEDLKRAYIGIEIPEKETPEGCLRQWLVGAQTAEEYYTPDWWEGESFYIQMMVEKIDLVNMFQPVCAEYHIPIVNAGGWYDISERASAAKRFKEAEEKGLTPVILYCGDLDPYGQAISDFLLKNFWEIAGGTDWMPTDLVVDRFGLNYDFVVANNLTWIDNLESSSGRDMSLLNNRIVRNYIAQIGKRKCEANALMRADAREAGLRLCRDAIEKYLGKDALGRFEVKRERIRARLRDFRTRTGLDKTLQKALELIEGGNGDTHGGL